MQGAQNGIIGNDFGTALPETQLQEPDLTLERNQAKFSRTAEFKVLQKHLEERIAYYQTHLPDGRDPADIDPLKAGQMWMVSNAVVGELKAILGAYELARETVLEADRRKNAQ